VLVRYGELALKGGNRGAFEKALAQNIKRATRDIASVRIERTTGRFAIFPRGRAMDVARRTQDVFGIKSVSPAWGAEPDPEAILPVARAVFDQALATFPTDRPVSCRISTTRADKAFPYTSPEFDRHVAEAVLPGRDRVRVQLVDPELELGIDIRPERAWIFSQRMPGPGGLPVGTLGSVLCLLSGGLDSPVAAWMTMKRGCRVGFVSFHSAPYLGEGSRKKVLDLARALGRYQGRSRLYVVPFAECQEQVRDAAPEGYRTVLYRRMMQRIASELAERDRWQALVTGESLGQVASQTLENMTCIGAAASLPVLRPLLGFDKEETIEIARRIGTFELSNRPEPDCCTVFQPRRPVIRGRLDLCHEVEAAIGMESLCARAVEGVEVIPVEYEG
jgi:thiamine biosynthesis protein ThiI